jgi:NDP-sugar pyrophosphorylase family protein
MMSSRGEEQAMRVESRSSNGVSSNAGHAVAGAVILAGGLRPTPLSDSTKCSTLDLWLTPNRTVIDLWLDHLAELGTVDVKVLWNDGVPRPTLDQGDTRIRASLVPDLSSFRGPAGAVRDACAAMSPDDLLLVCEATRYFDADLADMVNAHVGNGADVTVACNRDRTPAGVYLIRRSLLDYVPPIGFMDLKEQWLGKVIGAGHGVFAHRLESGTSHVLRTREQFLAAARAANGVMQIGRMEDGCMISSDATVHETAMLWDSVVMGGATIDAGAVVVRSLVGPGAHVRSHDVVVDRVVGASRGRSD